MTRSIAFIANAKKNIGGGHIFRCLGLMEIFLEEDWNCHLLCEEDSIQFIPQLERFRAFINISSLESFIKNESSVNCLVIDDYEKDVLFEKECRSWAEKIIVFDDLNEVKHDCELLINSLATAEKSNYVGFVPKNCNVLTGPAYAPLRKQFLQERNKHLKQIKDRKKINSVFINFGASDSYNLSSLFLQSICETKFKGDIHLVLGEQQDINNDIKEKIISLNNKLFIYRSVYNMAEIMSKCDIAFGAAGSSTWERCCLGLPSIIVESASNQKETAKSAVDLGVAINLGDASILNTDIVSKSITQLLDAEENLNEISNNALNLVDGLGINRIACIISPPVIKKNKPIYLYPTCKEHSETIFKWQSEPNTRKFSRNKSMPTNEEHNEWFRRKFADPKCIMHTIFCEHEPVGVLRLDEVELDSYELVYEVSIYLGSEFYGMKIGYAALEIIKKLIGDAALIAYIFDENIPSINLFKSAGFVKKQDYYLYSPIYPTVTDIVQ